MRIWLKTPNFEELIKSFKNENSNMLGNIFLKILSSAFFEYSLLIVRRLLSSIGNLISVFFH